MLITASPMAATLPDLGARVLERLANAELVFGWQGVFGLLNDDLSEVALGSMAVQGRRKSVLCMTADLDAVVGGVSEGVDALIGQITWRIAGRVDHPLNGQSTLALERP